MRMQACLVAPRFGFGFCVGESCLCGCWSGCYLDGVLVGGLSGTLFLTVGFRRD